MVRLHPGFVHYLFFVLCLYASVTVVESLMMVIASVVPNFLMGIIVGAGIQVSCSDEDKNLCFVFASDCYLSHICIMKQGIFMLVSGFFRLPYDIPKPLWRYPMSYISFHFWAVQVNFWERKNLIPNWKQAYHDHFNNVIFTGTIPKWSEGSIVRQPNTEPTKDPGRIHTQECVWDQSESIKMGGPVGSLLHDHNLPHIVLCHDQDQRRHQSMDSRVHCKAKTTDE